MQSPSSPFLGFSTHLNFSSLSTNPLFSPNSLSQSRVHCSSFKGGKSQKRRDVNGVIKIKEKENVWSIDNNLAKQSEEKEIFKGRRRKKGKRVKNLNKKDPNSRVLVSGSMLVGVETVLQTQEPVIRPVWNTFASSLSGIWKGVGAVFSPITAEMEPIDVGSKNENLYDCYTLLHIEAVGDGSQVQRKINWVTLNPSGEIQQKKGMVDVDAKSHDLPKFESFNFVASDVLEEDFMRLEPGLVFFEDGSYSRGPVDIPVGAFDESKYFHSPTFKFEQCLVKGCHKRLRIVHTIEFNNGGSDIQIMRVAVYEEQWITTANLSDNITCDTNLDVTPFSQRTRIQPVDLTGSWKVFEVSATPIYGEGILPDKETPPPYVYLCTETLKKRNLPENSVYFGEEEMLDMQDVALLWLPGGVTAYVDVDKEGVLCIGVGWYSNEGVNIVMERDYGLDGKLKEVRSKSEVKRRWSDALSM
ncbi:hypothetical protein ACHQM5_007332 [Ranunculus cassubicifolius]